MLRLPTHAELRLYVRTVLAGRADLDVATPLVQRLLRRQGEPCGVEYTLLAGKSVRLSAIWDAVRGQVYFYDQNLERFQVSRVQGPAAWDLDPSDDEALASPVFKGK